MTDLTRTTLKDLYSFDRRDELDRCVRGVCLSMNCDYLTGLRWLEEWAESAAESHGGKVRAEHMSLAAVVGESPIRLSRFEADVLGMEGDTEKVEEAITLAREEAEQGQEVDELGRVRLPDEPAPDGGGVYMLSAEAAEERSTRLTDPPTLEAAYQRALSVDDSYRGEAGRQRFESENREYVEQGLDLPATLERRQREADEHHRRMRADRAQRRLEGLEAERRAKARKRG
jgi:hypothetical protein